MYGIGYEESDVKTKRVGSGLKSLTSDSHFPKLQENFEHNLGIYAYNNPKAIGAVDRGLGKMRRVLVTYYKNRYSNIRDQAEREAQICLDAFTNTDDPTSAGQVGKVKYEQLCEIIGSNIPESDREINSQVDRQTGMAGAGNLREKMTAFYNAAYYKGYADKNPEANITNFKNIAQKIAVGGKSELVDELDLDSSILEEQENTSTDPRKAGVIKALYNAGAAHKVIGFWGKFMRFLGKSNYATDTQFSKRMHTRDVYDMGLISLGQNSLGAMVDNIRSGSNLRYRGEEEQKETQRSLDYYNKMGLNLSERERNYILETVSQQYLESHKAPERDESETVETFNKRMKDYTIRYAVYMDKVRKKLDPDYTPEESLEREVYDEFANDPMLNDEVEKTKSPIKEGIVYKDIPKQGGFLKDVMVDQHNVRIVNGISMTTARMLKTFKWLGLKSDLKNFRLALMGWMLPTDDHSLWEIIIGSHNVGVVGEEDLADIVSLDQSVDPLTKAEIRENVCEKVEGESLFPHEIVYLKQRNALGENDESYRKTKTVSSELFSSDEKSLSDEFKAKSGAIFMSEEEQNLIDENADKDIDNIYDLAILASDYLSDLSGESYDAYTDKLLEHEELYEKLFGYDIGSMAEDEFINFIGSLEANQIDYIIKRYHEKIIGHTAQKLAVLNYTGDMYQPMNEAAESANGGYFKRLYFKSSLKDHFYGIKDLHEQREKLCKNLKEAKNNQEKEQILENIREVDEAIKKKKTERSSDEEYQQYIKDLDTEINMTKDALDSAPKKSNVHVYSGTWMAKSKLFTSYKKNKTIAFNMFTSTSKNIEVAKDFIGGLSGLSGPKELFGKNALLDIKLNGKKAIDITDDSNGDDMVMSVYGADEEEVLCPPGTKIKINEVIDDVDLRSYKGNGEEPKVMSKEDYKKENEIYESRKSEVEEANANDEYIDENHELYKYNQFNKRFGTLVKCEEV